MGGRGLCCLELAYEEPLANLMSGGCFFDGKKIFEFSDLNSITMIFDFFENPTLRFKKEKQRRRKAREERGKKGREERK